MYFMQTKVRPQFPGWRTSCRRGYIATWKIVGNELHLESWDQDEVYFLYGARLPLSAIFPDRAPPYFANWFTGYLFCEAPGNELNSGYTTLSINVENGLVKENLI